MSFSEIIMKHEPAIRLSFFFGMLVLVAGWEYLFPRRERRYTRLLRWSNNLGLTFFNTFAARGVFLLIGMTSVQAAMGFREMGWGLFNINHLPSWLEILLTVLILDFFIYVQHVMVHAVPLLWRLHRVHHADPDYDVTTGARFHPLEIILSLFIKLGAIFFLGAPPAGVLVFEIVLNATAMFNHGNIRLPGAIDRVLRLCIVTPDMHRVHHSTRADEANSNFGFNLPWWDRIFGTYRSQPREGHEGMDIGIATIREPKQTVWITGLLSMPFAGGSAKYTVNRSRDGETEK